MTPRVCDLEHVRSDKPKDNAKNGSKVLGKLIFVASALESWKQRGILCHSSTVALECVVGIRPVDLMNTCVL